MIRFISHWKKEEKRSYTISKSKIKKRDAEEVSKNVSKKIVELEVLEVQEDFFLLEWNEFNMQESFFQKLFRKLFKLRLGEIFTISYKTTKAGVIDELVDTEDLEEQIRYAKAYIEPIGKDKNAKEFLKTTLNTDVISAKLLRLINIFHFPYGEVFSKEEVIEDIEVSNIFMEDNDIPVELRNSLVYLDDAHQIGEILLEKKYDQSALNKIMKESFTVIDQKLAKNRVKENFPLFVATEHFWYKVDFKSGWIINGKYEKVYLTKEGEHIEQIEIDLME